MARILDPDDLQETAPGAKGALSPARIVSVDPNWHDPKAADRLKGKGYDPSIGDRESIRIMFLELEGERSEIPQYIPYSDKKNSKYGIFMQHLKTALGRKLTDPTHQDIVGLEVEREWFRLRDHPELGWPATAKDFPVITKIRGRAQGQVLATPAGAASADNGGFAEQDVQVLIVEGARAGRTRSEVTDELLKLGVPNKTATMAFVRLSTGVQINGATVRVKTEQPSGKLIAY